RCTDVRGDCRWCEVAFARREPALQHWQIRAARMVNARGPRAKQASRTRRSHMEAPSNCQSLVTNADRTPGEGATHTLPCGVPPDVMSRETGAEGRFTQWRKGVTAQ